MSSPAGQGYMVAVPSPFVVDQSPFGQSPAQQPDFGLIEIQRARVRARTMSYNLPLAEMQNLQMNEMAPPQAANPTASASPTGYGSSSPAGFAMPGRFSSTKQMDVHTPIHSMPIDTRTCFPEASQQIQQIEVPAHAHALKRRGRAQTVGALPCSHVSVAVIAPGGGTGINASVYAAMGRKDGCRLEIVGQSRAPYDRYPASWGDQGAPAPNLESFTLDLLSKNALANSDVLVVGSRGGQVVLPVLWQRMGDACPPAVVMNGGCAMGLPAPVQWPTNAATFVLLGGQDYFRGNQSMQNYVADAKSRVPQDNKTTAILLVHEMTHMPQAELLNQILMHMIRAIHSWHATGNVPVDDFSTILGDLRRGSWSGVLTYKTGAGDSWKMEAFP